MRGFRNASADIRLSPPRGTSVRRSDKSPALSADPVRWRGDPSALGEVVRRPGYRACGAGSGLPPLPLAANSPRSPEAALVQQVVRSARLGAASISAPAKISMTAAAAATPPRPGGRLLELPALNHCKSQLPSIASPQRFGSEPPPPRRTSFFQKPTGMSQEEGRPCQSANRGSHSHFLHSSEEDDGRFAKRFCEPRKSIGLGAAIGADLGGHSDWQRRPQEPFRRHRASGVLNAPAELQLCGQQQQLSEPSASLERACAGPERVFAGPEALARVLINTCGSLERAFTSFDCNHRGRLTRTQFETAILLLKMDCEEVCGVTAKQLFKLLDTVDGPGNGEVTLENWTHFFEQLKGTSAANLLEEDKGKWGGRRLTVTKHDRWGGRFEKKHSDACGGGNSDQHEDGRPDSSSVSLLGSQSPEMSARSDSGSLGGSGHVQLTTASAALSGQLRNKFRAAEVPQWRSASQGGGSGGPGRSPPPAGHRHLRGLGVDGTEAGMEAAQPTRSIPQQRRPSKGGLGPRGGPLMPPDGEEAVVDAIGSEGPPRSRGRRVPSDGGAVFTRRAAAAAASAAAAATASSTAAQAKLAGKDGRSHSQGRTNSWPGGEAAAEVASAVASAAAAATPGGSANVGPLSASDGGGVAHGSVSRGRQQPPAMKPRNEGWDEFTNKLTNLDSDSDSEDGGAVSPLAITLTSPDGGRKDRAAGENFKRTLQGLNSLEVLDDEELGAMAEHEQLEEELQELDLSGISALAYVLVAKLGSLKKAYRYFDATRRGKVAQVVWDTGILVLRIDTERLTGFKPSVIFAMIDNNPRDGVITKKEWRDFFRDLQAGTLGEHLRGAAGEGEGLSLAERAAEKRDKLAKRRKDSEQDKQTDFSSKQEETRSRRERHREAAGDSAQAGQHQASSSAAQDEEDGAGRRKATRARDLAALAPADGTGHSRGEGATDTGSRGRGEHAESGANALRALGATDGALAHTQVSETPAASAEDGAFTARGLGGGRLEDMHSDLVGMSELEFRERIRRELSSLGVNEFSEFTQPLEEWQLEIVAEIAEELGLFHAASGGGVFVCNCREFADETREQLLEIQQDSSFVFPTTLCEVQRKVVHLLAEEYFLFAKSEGKGKDRHIIVYNMGTFAEDIRRDLGALLQDESKVFPKDLSAAHRRIVHVIAAELGLWVNVDHDSEGGVALEVFNLASFAQQMREELSQLKEGEEKTFTNNFTEKQRKVLLSIAVDLGLVALSESDAISARGFTVGRLDDFREETQRALGLLEAGESHAFDGGLTQIRRKVVQEVARELGMKSATRGGRGANPSKVVSVTRPGPGSEDSALGDGRHAARTRGSSNLGDDMDEGKVSSRTGSKTTTDEDEFARMHEAQGETTQSMITKLFNRYATGHHRGERIFLRFPDLKEFAEDARGVAPERHRMFCRFEGVLETTFDDTVQLQSDMGVKTTKGLTYQWFSVFVQKAMKRLGMQIVGLLMALLDDRPVH